jgi:Asp-tRNA(Asn)/Glu-tRNA(Gln) amidotransferase A subunit family amidase
LLHGPCLTVPVLASTEGLPLGLQLVGPRYSDARMLAAAATVVDILKLSAVPTAGQVRADNRRAT